MSEPLLQVEKIEVVYKRVITAVQGVTLSVGPKQIVAILGTNGAGKTTTLRAISGFLGLDDARITEGTISFEGHADREPLRRTRSPARGIVLVPEREKVFPNLTVAENLAAPVSRASAAERRRQESGSITSFRALPSCASRIGGLLSGGERQMLAIAGALMCRPSLLAGRRTVARACACRRAGSDAAAACGPRRARHRASCWSSRAPPPRWRSPTMPM